MTVGYTDSGGGAQTITIPFYNAAGTSGIVALNATGMFYGNQLIFRNSGTNTITVTCTIAGAGAIGYVPVLVIEQL